MRPVLLMIFGLMIPTATIAQSGNSKTMLQTKAHRFPIEKGKIIYTLTGSTSGTTTLYFDRFGWRQLWIKESTFEKYGIKISERSLELIDGDFIYRYNPDKKTGTRYQDTKWSQLAAYRSLEETKEAILSAEGGTAAGDSSILNKGVKKWIFDKGIRQQLFEWEGIVFLEIRSMSGIKYSMHITSIDTEIEIPEKRFNLPEDVTWVTP